MSQVLTLELPDELYQAVTKAAEEEGQTAAAWIAAQLPQVLPAPLARPDYHELRRQILERDYEFLLQLAPYPNLTFEQFTDLWVEQCIAGMPQPRMPEEQRAAREADKEFIRRFAGALNSGNPRSGDNEQIDADLAREYESTHENEV